MIKFIRNIPWKEILIIGLLAALGIGAVVGIGANAGIADIANMLKNRSDK